MLNINWHTGTNKHTRNKKPPTGQDATPARALQYRNGNVRMRCGLVVDGCGLRAFSMRSDCALSTWDAVAALFGPWPTQSTARSYYSSKSADWGCPLSRIYAGKPNNSLRRHSSK